MVRIISAWRLRVYSFQLTSDCIENRFRLRDVLLMPYAAKDGTALEKIFEVKVKVSGSVNEDFCSACQEKFQLTEPWTFTASEIEGDIYSLSIAELRTISKLLQTVVEHRSAC